ncbi:hypothetical protein DWW23_05945 [Parabacteroides sp. AF14-59]|nr:hypothetical protein DWW23_05945 [Parabacteroides sp. AF14-59]
MQVYLPSASADGLQVVSFFGFSHISLSIESAFKMGLKSKEVDHLPNRQLKQTANEPVMAKSL